MTTSQQQAIKEILPVLSVLLLSGWFPKKYRQAAKIAIGVLQAIADATPEVSPLESPSKAQLLEQALTAQESIGSNFSALQTT
ncbi:MAG TPA: hypothetical protein VKG87_09425 [Terriglobales bacterium]|nr:hypothetical protein [Terriglobales bacterium]